MTSPRRTCAPRARHGRRGGGRTTSRGLHRVDSVRAEVDTSRRLVVIGADRRRAVRRAAHPAVVPPGRGRREPRGGRAGQRDEIVQVPASAAGSSTRKGRVLARDQCRSRRWWSTASSSPTTDAHDARGEPRGACSERRRRARSTGHRQPELPAVRAGPGGARTSSSTSRDYVARAPSRLPRASRESSHGASVPERRRSRPHVLGYVGQINPEELTQRARATATPTTT